MWTLLQFRFPLLIISTVVFLSCTSVLGLGKETNVELEPATQVEVEEVDMMEIEDAELDRSGSASGTDMRSRADLDLMLDDMGLTPGQSSQAGITGEYFRWPNRQVIYEVDPAFTPEEKSTIYSAMYDIQGKTCIRFKPRTSSTPDWVFIQRGGGGCWSWIGRQGGRQILTLKPAAHRGDSHCIWAGTAAHELIHAIGFYHEQARPDRDDWVNINWANIQPNMRSNFNKLTWSDASTYNVPYDYRSIMHYDAYAFAVNKNMPTIFPKQSGAFLGNHVVSSYDARKINAMYKC